MDSISLLSSDEESEISQTKRRLPSGISLTVLPPKRRKIHKKAKEEIITIDDESVKADIKSAITSTQVATVQLSDDEPELTILAEEKVSDDSFTNDNTYSKDKYNLSSDEENFNIAKEDTTTDRNVNSETNNQALGEKELNPNKVVDKDVEMESKPNSDLESHSDSEIKDNTEAGSSNSQSVSNNHTSHYSKLIKTLNQKLEFIIESCNKLVTTQRQDKFNNLSTTARKILCTLAAEKRDLHGFEEFLNTKEQIINDNSSKAIEVFIETFEELKTLKQTIVIDGTEKRLNKLWKLYEKCNKKIKKLEEAEVDFSLEEDSQYIQESRYKSRAANIYKVICKLSNKNPNAINMLHQRYVIKQMFNILSDKHICFFTSVFLILGWTSSNHIMPKSTRH